MLFNKEFQTLILIKNGILICHVALDSVKAIPSILNSIWLQVDLQPVIGAFIGLQSVGDLESMYILI